MQASLCTASQPFTCLGMLSDACGTAYPRSLLLRLDEGAHLDPSDRGIYLINCLALLLSQLEGAACAEGLAARIRWGVDGAGEGFGWMGVQIGCMDED